MFLPETTAFIAALLFATHPIHTEAVSIFTKAILAFMQNSKKKDVLY